MPDCYTAGDNCCVSLAIKNTSCTWSYIWWSRLNRHPDLRVCALYKNLYHLSGPYMHDITSFCECKKKNFLIYVYMKLMNLSFELCRRVVICTVSTGSAITYYDTCLGYMYCHYMIILFGVGVFWGQTVK